MGIELVWTETHWGNCEECGGYRELDKEECCEECDEKYQEQMRLEKSLWDRR